LFSCLRGEEERGTKKKGGGDERNLKEGGGQPNDLRKLKGRKGGRTTTKGVKRQTKSKGTLGVITWLEALRKALEIE